MARPTKLTEQTVSDLCAMVASGASFATAARASGITDRTFRNWLDKGRELAVRREQGGRLTAPQRLLLQLLDSVERAEAQFEVRLVAMVNRAANDDWRAAMTLLERRVPDPWAGTRRKAGRPIGSTSAPDRPNAQPEPPRIRLRSVD
jgi:hypothetical protein